MPKIEVEVRGAQGGGSTPPQPHQAQPTNTPTNNGAPASVQPGGGIVTPSSAQQAAGGTATPASSVGTNGSSVPPVGGSVPSTPQGSQSINDRLAADIRREISTRGVVLVPGTANFTTMMQQITRQVGDNNTQAITKKYASERADLAQRITDDTNKALAGPGQDIVNKYASSIANASTDADKEYYEKKRDAEIDRLIAPILNRGKLEGDSLTQRENSEKAEAEEALTQVMKDLTEEYRRGNPNSYMGKLREDYRAAVWKRDNAETAEDVKKYSKEAQDIQKRMAEAQGFGSNPMTDFGRGWSQYGAIAMGGVQAYNLYQRNKQQQISTVDQAASGDILGAMQSDIDRSKGQISGWAGLGTGVVGAAVGGYFGGGIGAGAGWGIGSSVGTTIGGAIADTIYADDQTQLTLARLWNSREKQIGQFNSFAALHNTGSIAGVRDSLIQRAGAGWFSRGVDNYTLGMTSGEFMQDAASRVKQRGFSTSVDADAAYAIDSNVIEKYYNLNQGQLGQWSSNDRYADGRRKFTAGQTVNFLTSALENQGTLGMTRGTGYGRVGEFMGYLQQLEQAQMSWMRKLSDVYATQMLVRGQRAFGNDFDQRHISEMIGLDQRITNSIGGGGMMEVLMNQVVQDKWKSTRGNLNAIEDKIYSENPEDRAAIQQGMVERIEKLYGGMNTVQGRAALKQFTGITNPKDLAAIVNQIKNGIPAITANTNTPDAAYSSMKDYTMPVTQQMAKMSDTTFQKLVDKQDVLIRVSQQLLNAFDAKLNELIEAINGN